MKIDTSDMAPSVQLSDADEISLAKKATEYITSFAWHGQVVTLYSAFNLADKIGVFLVKLKPTRKDVDDILWLVVGDLPSAYLVCDDANNWLEALQCYVREMDRWVSAVKSKSGFNDVIPVNAPPTEEFAEMLSRRLGFIRDHVIHGEWENS